MVDFDSNLLINKCIESIDKNLVMHRGRLNYTKRRLSIDIGGLTNDDSKTKSSILNLDEKIEVLPDIIGYLQNETQLTRKSLVKILTGCKKLDYFKTNPQKFLENCIDIINDQMRLHIVDGVKYQKIGENEFYSQELFQNEELYGYLNSNLKESSKSPYEYVVYDSNIESSFTNELEQSDNVSVYAKLPEWFQIETPIGKYNPDWVVSWKDEHEEKLFFVVESKGSISESDLRPKELAKIECGKKHFKELGSQLKLATKLTEVIP